MNTANVSRDDWILGGVALLLIIDLLFLPWFSVSVAAGAFSATFSSTATGAPSGLLGILAVLALIAVGIGLLEFGPNYLARSMHTPAPQAQVTFTAGDALEDCSPLATLDGLRMLVFNARRGVVAEGVAAKATTDAQLDLALALDDLVDGTPRKEIAGSANMVVAGTFSVDEATRTVVLHLPEGLVTYTLLGPMPFEQDECVLVDGTTSAADLNRSWFGTPGPDEPQADDVRADP